MNILVTGGAGFIGSHLCERILKTDKHVICLDNFDDFYDPSIKMNNITRCLNSANFELIRGDIRDKITLEAIFQNNQISKIVHIAAKAGVRPSIRNPLLYEDVNVRGTLNLLEACKNHRVENFIFASSSSVYGINSKLPFGEDDPISKPISPYAASKRSCEMYCFTYHHLYGIPITCLRFFTVYGPRQRPEMAIHKFTRLISAGEEVEIYGSGSSKRDYTFIDDVIEGIVSLLDKKFDFEIINLGNSEPVELEYLIELIEKGLNKTASIKRLPAQAGDVPITFADISKAKSLLNYNPKTSIEKGIKRFAQWYLSRKQQQRSPISS